MRYAIGLAAGALGLGLGPLLSAAGSTGPAAATRPTTVLRFTETKPPGTARVSTPSFTIAAGDTWRASFSIRCNSSGYTTSSFAAQAYRGGRHLFDIRTPTAKNLDYLERVSGYSGSLHLEVSSPCPWSVVVSTTKAAAS